MCLCGTHRREWSHACVISQEFRTMTERVHYSAQLIFSAGTLVVSLRDVIGQNGRTIHPRGAVGLVIGSSIDLDNCYRVRFPDGLEVSLARDELVMLARYKEGEIGDVQISIARSNLSERLLFRCVVGSRAFGLDDDQSDTDYRGVFLPPAEMHWSLYGVPEQIECDETQEHYWEVQRFLVLALKANPNVLECLYTPLIETRTPLGAELLEMRSAFLSRLIYQTYNGYVMSQFKKMQSDLRNQGQVKWKHVMHLIRLLISGTSTLRNGFVPVRIEDHRDQLLAIKRGEVPWAETEKWRLNLHLDFGRALADTTLPERPDYERANAFLIKARRAALCQDLP
jgi:predicted nucleotidyltransferase